MEGDLTQTEPVASDVPKVDESKVKALLEQIKAEQNFVMGINSGVVATLIGAVLWAVISAATQHQIGYMAIGIGALVGFAIRKFGKGISPAFGYLGGALSLIGCLLGNILTIIFFYANENSLNYFSVLLSIDFLKLPLIVVESFQPMDLLFYGIAIYFGYKFSFRTLTQAELNSVAAN
jgi:hypothetical protein